jgi:hypothetical protein
MNGKPSVFFYNCDDPICKKCGGGGKTKKEIEDSFVNACSKIEKAYRDIQVGNPKLQARLRALSAVKPGKKGSEADKDLDRTAKYYDEPLRSQVLDILGKAMKVCRGTLMLQCTCCGNGAQMQAHVTHYEESGVAWIDICLDKFCKTNGLGHTDLRLDPIAIHELSHFGRTTDDAEYVLMTDYGPGASIENDLQADRFASAVDHIGTAVK